MWKMKWNSVKVKETIDRSISNKIFLGTELPLSPPAFAQSTSSSNFPQPFLLLFSRYHGNQDQL